MLRRLLLPRLIDLVLVVAGVSVIVFLMIRLVPGDAVAIMLGANSEVTPQALSELRARIGLDEPFLVQYLRWAFAALHGDFGASLWTGRPVAEEGRLAAPVVPQVREVKLDVPQAAEPVGLEAGAGLPEDPEHQVIDARRI